MYYHYYYSGLTPCLLAGSELNWHSLLCIVPCGSLLPCLPPYSYAVAYRWQFIVALPLVLLLLSFRTHSLPTLLLASCSLRDAPCYASCPAVVYYPVCPPPPPHCYAVAHGQRLTVTPPYQQWYQATIFYNHCLSSEQWQVPPPPPPPKFCYIGGSSGIDLPYFLTNPRLSSRDLVCHVPQEDGRFDQRSLAKDRRGIRLCPSRCKQWSSWFPITPSREVSLSQATWERLDQEGYRMGLTQGDRSTPTRDERQEPQDQHSAHDQAAGEKDPTIVGSPHLYDYLGGAPIDPRGTLLEGGIYHGAGDHIRSDRKSARSHGLRDGRELD